VVYGTLHNPTEVPIVLTGVHSPDYAGATFHETIQDGPISRMRAIDELAILPGEELAFVPGGHHVMLHGRTREAGAVLLRLDTRDGRTLQVSTDPP
jgi:copper(I)-binding protein